MADVADTLAEWSSTTDSNSPSGATNIGTGLDNNLREIQGVVVRGLSHKGSDIASSTTPALGAVEGLSHDITGTATITGFDTVRAGIWKVLKFEGALTLTHNATSLILPTAANITTADGDVALFHSEGSGNWRCWGYFPASGHTPQVDSSAIVIGSSDKTKKVRLEVDGLTTGTTRVLTAQDKDLTIGPVLSSAVAVTSGTSVALSTTIPAFATGIDISLDAVSTDGSSNLLLQIGPTGGIESTGYTSGAVIANTPASASSTAGFLLSVSNASSAARNGLVSLVLLDASTNTWALSGNTNDVANVSVCSGSKSLAGVLTRVSITTVNGTDAFDGAGKIGIRVT